MLDPHDILRDVLAEHSDHDKWVGTPFERIKRVSNSTVGDVGQAFVERLCEELGFDIEVPRSPDGKRLRQSPWDISIEDVTFELKTATEDIGGSFQFNHLRYHREYDAVLCIGIAPADIYMGSWTKADVATGAAGKLISMEKGANASYKLIKRPDQLHPISEFAARVLNVLA
ncbi:MAG: hypothetical protein F4138_02010 [Acidimicrobiia bacterium]|nr:hypothetical protein [Acidimicrobiia bacterium]